MAYIKQEVVIDKFEKLKERAETLRDKIYLDGVLAVIENIPTADVVEVNHSKWNECHTNESNEKYCDSCGCDFNLYFHNRSMFRFCPYCGAMMHNEWIKHEDVVDDAHMAEWIDVNERLPERDGKYLVARKDGNSYSISVRKFRKEVPCWYTGYCGHWERRTNGITHWMPLPEPPKQ